MNNMLGLLERLLPLIAVILTLFSSAMGYLALRRSNNEIVVLKEKIDRQTKSQLVEDHEELPGFQQRSDVDDME